MSDEIYFTCSEKKWQRLMAVVSAARRVTAVGGVEDILELAKALHDWDNGAGAAL